MTTPAQHANVTHSGVQRHGTVHLPEPTPWPIVLSAGMVLVLAALVMHFAVALLGLALVVAGAFGWFRDVLPYERVENIEVVTEEINIQPSRDKVTRIEVGETHRAQLPLHTYPISAGLKGGIAGGIAMVIPAEIYSLVRYHTPWYVVNLLGGAGVGGWRNPTEAQIAHFHLAAFITANVIQGVTTLLVGLLYGALLPVWPKRPMLLGGIVAPVLWTGVLRSALGIVNPYLQQHIDWWSFAASQVIFGLVAGYVVSRIGGLQRLAQLPLAVRLGVESPGLSGENDRKEKGR
jgi:hypothetical protein